MKLKNLCVIAGLTSTVMVASAPSFATATWTSAGSPSSCQTNNGLSNSCTVTPTGTGGTSLVVTALSDSGTGNALAGAYIGYYDTNHWGVTTKAGLYSNGTTRSTNETQGSPNHAMDNEGNQEWLFYSFGADVTLSAVTLGWVGGTPPDSDITVMAYEPTGAQPLVPLPANGSTTDSGATGLVSKGWVVVGNYFNVGVGAASISTSVSSSYWLIGAYNSLGGTNYNANGTLCTSGCPDSNYDYVKVLSVAGSTSTTPPSGVPEPSSLLLTAIALFGLTALRRRRSA